MRQLHTRKVRSGSTVAAAGMMVPVIVGAPVAGAHTTVANVSLAASEALQSVIDEVLQKMQDAVTFDSSLPFTTPENNAFLPTGLQNVMFQNLSGALTRGATSGRQLPEVTATDAADVRQMFAYDNPDTPYTFGSFTPGATYELTGNIGAGTADLAINNLSQQGSNVGIGPGLELSNGLKVDPDGSFTVYFGPTDRSDLVPSGANYIDNTGYDGSILRDTLGDWAKGPGTFDIACIADCPAAASGAGGGLADATLSQLLSGLGQVLPGYNQLMMNLAQTGGILEPANTFSNFASESEVPGGLPSELISVGHFDLQPGQALIVNVPQVDVAPYHGIELMTAFGQTLPYSLAQTSLNNSQAFADPDGYIHYVISGTNPGVANWLDSGALSDGAVIARFQGIPGDEADGVIGQQVTTRVVPVDDVAQYLPADTPTVTPAQYAADMTERVLSYDYTMDVARGSSWVTQQMELNAVESLMGTKNFEDVFGIQPSTPMWLRLTPVLSPDSLALMQHILADPSGSWTAIQDNLSLATRDVSLPFALAGALLQQDFAHTSQAVQDALSSGDLTQALTSLTSGAQQLGQILSDALLDPNSSIIAGLLNARDDLATAIFTATGGFPTQSDPLAVWEWDNMSQLTQLDPSSTPAEIGSVLHSLDFGSLFG